jgi:hypothetical protein
LEVRLEDTLQLRLQAGRLERGETAPERGKVNRSAAQRQHGLQIARGNGDT